MPGVDKGPRANQRYRTRRDLLRAAAAILETGKVPTLEEVAREARVSRATIYRYFSSVEALLAEAPLDLKVPSPERLFGDDASHDPVERLDRAEVALAEMMRDNETQLRVLLSLAVRPRDGSEDGGPVRQNRRTPLIEGALAPVRERLDDETYRNLVAALALVFGTESMVVFRDVLTLDDGEARRVKSWAIGALVGAALRDSGSRPR